MNFSLFISSARMLAIALFLCGNARAGTARYGVLNLREAYGLDIRSFKGMSPGGVLTGSTGSNLVRIANGQRTDFVPAVPGGYQKFDDRGISYYLPDDLPNARLHTLAADGTRTDTGYSPDGEMTLSLGGSNRLGVIVGHQDGGPLPEGGYQTGAFIYDPASGGSFKSYYVPYGGVHPYSFDAINDAGYIVGSSGSALYLWTPGVPAIRLVTTDSGTATAINEAAQIVGDDGIRAFFWENGTLTRPVSKKVEDPARPGIFNEAVTESSAPDINENGVVVGTAAFRSVPGFTKPLHNTMGWMWTKDGGLVWLDDLIDPALGIDITGAKNITDDGQILAFGFGPGSTTQQFYLLTVPEPGTASLLILSCLVFARRRR